MELKRDYIALEEEVKKELDINGTLYNVTITPYKGWQGGGVDIEGVGVWSYMGFTHKVVDDSHCCGLQGFNPMLGDDCPACKTFWSQSRIMDDIMEQLKVENIIKTEAKPDRRRLNYEEYRRLKRTPFKR